MIRSLALIILVLIIVFVVACGNNTAVNDRAATPPPTAMTPATTPPAEPARAAEPDGRELFALNCIICHKEDGSGGRVSVEGKSLRSEDLRSAKFKKMSDEKLADEISHGHPDEGMPAFEGKLSDDEIAAVVKHIRMLQQ